MDFIRWYDIINCFQITSAVAILDFLHPHTLENYIPSVLSISEQHMNSIHCANNTLQWYGLRNPYNGMEWATSTTVWNVQPPTTVWNEQPLQRYEMSNPYNGMEWATPKMVWNEQPPTTVWNEQPIQRYGMSNPYNGME